MEKNLTVNTYILDTSVVVKWFSSHSEDDRVASLRLRQDILNGECAVVAPTLLFYELANALRYNPRFNAKDVNDAVNSVMEMGFEVYGVEVDTMAQAVEMAFRFHVAVYDTYFLAVSQTKKKPLLTADYRFADRMKGFKNIIKLSDFVP